MSVDLVAYSRQIIAAADALSAARDPDHALAALDRLNALAHDHEMLRLMATSFQLLAEQFMTDLAHDQSDRSPSL